MWDFIFDYFNLERFSSDKTVNNFGKYLLDLCAVLNIHMMNGRCGKDKQVGDFTFMGVSGASVIDYLLASSTLFEHVIDFSIDSRCESTHIPLTMKLRTTLMTRGDCNNNTKHKTEKSFIFVWDNKKLQIFRDNLHSDPVQALLDKSLDTALSDTDRSIGYITDALCLAASDMRRQTGKPVRDNLNNWFDSECESLKKDRCKSLNIFRKNKDRKSLDEYHKTRNKYSATCKQKRKDYFESKQKRLEDSINDSKQFWLELKSFNPKKTENCIHIEEWYKYFENLFASPDKDPDSHYYHGAPESKSNMPFVNQILDAPITRDEILESIQHLKCNKSPGIDDTISEFFKNSADILLPYLELIFNVILETSIFPESWSVGVIVPIHKQGDKNSTNNYRGITLLSIFSKIFTYIVNKRLVLWADTMDKINEEQAGFREGYSTVDNIFILQTIVQKYLSTKGGKFYALFVDFSKAFDSVNRHKLWNLLRSHGLSRKMNKLLCSIYENIKVCVRHNNEVSKTFTSHVGVRQGCILSPFLFSFFINELATQIHENCNHGIQLHPDITQLFLLLFADDIILFSSTINGLQREIDELENYCDNWKLSVNMDKTKVVVFKNGGKISGKEKWFFKGERLEITPFYKYLGVYFTKTLSWNRHTEEAATQAQKVFVSIYKQLNVLGNIAFEPLFKIFDVKISPILLYGSEVWGLQYFDVIEKVHLYVCKRFLGVKTSTPSAMVYGECGRFPMHIFSQVKAIKYWLRLLNMPAHRFPKKCYNMMIVYDNNGKTNWVTNIKTLLFKTGFGSAWYDQNVNCYPNFIKSLTQRLKDIYVQTWFESMTLSNKCFYYKLFKGQISLEWYLSKITVKKFRVALSRFRCSSHDLFVETGRYSNINRQERLCQVCDLNDVEDEYHFLLVCPLYSDLRRKYFPK